MALLEHGIRLTFRSDPENNVLKNSIPVKSGWNEMGGLSKILNQHGIFEDVWQPRFYLGEIIIYNRDNYKENETLSQWAFICPFRANDLKEQIENVKNKIKEGLLNKIMKTQEFVKSYVVEQSIKRYIGFKSVFTHFDEKTKMDKFIVVMGNETFQFGKGTGLRKNGMPFPPTITEFLLCVSMDCQAGEMHFEEFCSEFGYDPDSRKAYKMWEDCKENKEKMKKILDPEGYEELLQIEEEE